MSSTQSDRPLSLRHLRRLTDCFGIVQHANHALPDYRTGYTTDDNARALVVAIKHHRLKRDRPSRDLAARYLAFLLFAHTPDGRFHNFIGCDRRPLDDVGSEDCFGRAFWALAWMLQAPPEPHLVGPAQYLFHRALRWVPRLEHPRARAFSLTALHRWAQACPHEKAAAAELAEPLGEYLAGRYREHSRADWDWLLPEMTYDNAKLPEALFCAYQITGQEQFLTIARRAMDFLCRKSFADGVLCLVGNHGWYRSDVAEPPLYDQQPVDAAAMVEAAIAGFDATGDADYLGRACVALDWFFGRNCRGLPLYDAETGGCFDALMESGVNQNRGAESTISLLLAQLSVLEAGGKASRPAPSQRRASGPAEVVSLAEPSPHV